MFRAPVDTSPHATLEPDDDVAIADAGRAMDAQVMTRAFEPFFTSKDPAW